MKLRPTLGEGLVSVLMSLLVLSMGLILTGFVSPARVGGAISYSGVEYTLDDFPQPFVNGTLEGMKTYVVIPSSSPHGPCGSAHTMDTMGGVKVAYTLGLERGRANITSKLETSLDSYSYISSYDEGTARATMQDVTSNLIVIGGPGVNQVAYYYNELRDYQWNKLLPVVYERDAQGDHLLVQSSGSKYYIERDGQGRVIADYGVIQIFKDGVRYMLLFYGLGGEATRVSAEVLSDFRSYNMTGRAIVLKYYDSDSNGLLDKIVVAESVMAPESTVEIYSDSGCTQKLTAIDWGSVEPGESYHSTLHVKNLGTSAVFLSLGTQNWDPSDASQFMSLDWDYSGAPLGPNEVAEIVLTLTVSANATDISDFSFEIVITGEG